MSYLFQFALGLHGLDPLLLDIPVSRLPHEEIFDDISHRFPWKKIVSDVVEIFPVFLDCFFKKICLRRWPVFHLIPAKHGAACGNERSHCFSLKKGFTVYWVLASYILETRGQFHQHTGSNCKWPSAKVARRLSMKLSPILNIVGQE